MRSSLFTRYRRWLGASALAILVGLGGGSAFLAASAPSVSAQQTDARVQQAAQVQPTAQITAPSVSNVSGFADLVDAVKPAVVSIIVESDQADDRFSRNGGQFDFRFPDLPDDHPFKDFFDQFRRFGDGQGDDQRQRRMPPRHLVAAGSGFIVSADGYIVTNNHVVENASKVTVIFDDGDEREAKIVGTDERTDLAVVKLDGVSDLPFVKLSEDDVRVGDWVVAVGNPFGLGGTVTAGIVSARGRDIAGSAYGDFLQIDAAVNTGNSGGPAFNLEGEVVGVNTAIFSPNGGNVGIAFAIPANVVKQVTDQLIAHGSVTRGYLGVGIQDVTRDIARSVGLDHAYGALVTEPQDDGPAQKAGIKSGDVITKVDGDDIEDALDLSRTIAGKDPGTAVEISFWRDGKEQSVKVTLDTLSEEEQAAQPAPEQPQQPDQPAQSSVGLTLVPDGNGQGLLIQDIDPDSIAAEKGFQVGDLILTVNNQPVKTADEFEQAISDVRDSNFDAALIKLQRGNNPIYIGLPLEDSGN